MNIKIIILSLLFISSSIHSEISFSDSGRGVVSGVFHQEGKVIFSAPLFKSYARLDKNNQPLKGVTFSKIIATGRGKLKLVPGRYAITALCSGTNATLIGKTRLTVLSGRNYRFICSSRNGKQALVLKTR